MNTEYGGPESLSLDARELSNEKAQTSGSNCRQSPALEDRRDQG
jgi:hypothetical protein